MASWISGWWNRPREQTLRRALFQLHLWTGVAIGLYLSAIGLTGALLIFEDDLEELFHPSNFHVTGPLLPAAPVSALLQGAQMAFPERQATAIYAPTAARQTYVVYLRRGDEVLHAFLHPVTGEITGTTPFIDVVCPVDTRLPFQSAERTWRPLGKRHRRSPAVFSLRIRIGSLVAGSA